MASVLFVSKPVAPPWNDSGKNLVRDVARGLTKHRPTLMVRSGDVCDVPGARTAVVYARAGGGFAPALTDQARVFAHLLSARGHDLWHFFFAPNPKSCTAGRWSSRLRGKRTVHTLSSAPRDVAAVIPHLFADVNVVLSEHSERRFLEAGLARERLVRIAPAIEPLAPLDADARRAARERLGLPKDTPLVLFPGDLEFGEGGLLTAQAAALLARRDVHWVMACRAKTQGAKDAEARLRAEVSSKGLDARFTWIGETPHIHALLGCADVVTLPSVDLYAKMDYPLVLLEAMSLERPVIVAEGSAAAEIATGGGAQAVAADAEAVAASIERLLSDRDAARAMGTRAAQVVLERYAIATLGRDYEAVYDRLL